MADKKKYKKRAKFKSKANEKLKNVETIKKMLDGTHSSQTKKSIGFSDAEKIREQNKKREVGEVWTEINPISGQEETWVQKQGYRVKQSKFQAIRDAIREMNAFKNCPKEKCTCIKLSQVDVKMRAIHGMCMECVAEMETKLKIRGEFKEYERSKIVENAKAWLKQAEQEKEELKRQLTKTEFVQEDGTIEKWDVPYDMEEMAQQIDDQFEKFKEEFLENLEKDNDGIRKEVGE